MISNPTYRSFLVVIIYTVAYLLFGGLTSSLNPTVASGVILSSIVMSWAPLASWFAYRYTAPAAQRQPISKDTKRHLFIATAAAACSYLALKVMVTAIAHSNGLLLGLTAAADIIIPFVIFWVILRRLSPSVIEPGQTKGLIRNMLTTYLNIVTVYVVGISVFVYAAVTLNPGPGAIAGIILLITVPISAVLLSIKTVEFFMRAYKRRNNTRLYMLNTILGVICTVLALTAIVFTFLAYIVH